MVCPTAKELTYLGPPLTTEALEATMESHVSRPLLLIKCTEELNSHIALYLLINCLGPTKVLYTLRTSRLYHRSDLLQTYDKIIASKASEIANVCINLTAPEQMSLPTALGGSGIGSIEELTLPAFLALAHSGRALLITPGTFDVVRYTGLQSRCGPRMPWPKFQQNP